MFWLNFHYFCFFNMLLYCWIINIHYCIVLFFNIFNSCILIHFFLVFHYFTFFYFSSFFIFSLFLSHLFKSPSFSSYISTPSYSHFYLQYLLPFFIPNPFFFLWNTNIHFPPIAVFITSLPFSSTFSHLLSFSHSLSSILLLFHIHHLFLYLFHPLTLLP